MVEIGNARKALAAPAYPTPRACRHGAWRSGAGDPTGAPDVTAARGKGWVAAAAGQWERQHTTGNERATHERRDQRDHSKWIKTARRPCCNQRRTDCHLFCNASRSTPNRAGQLCGAVGAETADRRAITHPRAASDSAAAAGSGRTAVREAAAGAQAAARLSLVRRESSLISYSHSSRRGTSSQVNRESSSRRGGCAAAADRPKLTSSSISYRQKSIRASRGCMASLRINSCLRLWGKRWGCFWLIATAAAAAAGAQCEEVSAQPISRVSSYPFRKIADGGLCAAAVTRYVGLAQTRPL